MGSEPKLTTQGGIWRYRFAQVVVLTTFLLILAGGNVTSKGAGLAVPDWPMSFGSFNPSGWTSNMAGTIPGVRDEHFHRLVGALIGFFVTVLTIWLIAAEPRVWVKRLGILAFVGVVAQGGLGGLRVVMKTQWNMDAAIWFAVLHGCVAQAFFCLTIALAAVLGPNWVTTPPAATDLEADRRLRQWSRLLTLMVFVQLLLGAVFRHTGMGLIGILHVCGALAVGAILIQVAEFTMKRPESERLASPTIALFLLYGVQIILGIAAYITVLSMDGRNPAGVIQTYVPTVHVGIGALILGTSFLLTLRSLAVTSPRGEQPVPVSPMKGEVLA